MKRKEVPVASSATTDDGDGVALEADLAVDGGYCGTYEASDVVGVVVGRLLDLTAALDGAGVAVVGVGDVVTALGSGGGESSEGEDDNGGELGEHDGNREMDSRRW